jgi:hypothetical protein
MSAVHVVKVCSTRGDLAEPFVDCLAFEVDPERSHLEPNISHKCTAYPRSRMDQHQHAYSNKIVASPPMSTACPKQLKILFMIEFRSRKEKI